MRPGNTVGVTTLLPVVDRLQRRFSIGRVCVVVDRGMISAATIAGLEECKLEYILGAPERSDAIVRMIVLENDDPFAPLLIEREAGETQLFVKQVKVEGIRTIRTIVCRNEEEAENDRKEREAIVAALDAQRGDKALIGNSACRRYLRKAGARDLLRELRALLMEGVRGRQVGRLVSRRAELDWLAGLPDRRGCLYSDSARAIAFRNGPLV
jgi:transposase